jgi:ATP-dependent phosphofructokinase / diphosphate-dependent phosphofructokinase
MTRRTLVIGQSGGATAVVNASLVGAVDAAVSAGSFDRVLGMRYGIDGLLNRDFSELVSLPRSTLDAIRYTPSAALGTGRRRLDDDSVERALDVVRELAVSAMVLIGGNDSAETALQLQHAAGELTVVVAPKTIDNDLPETDHCPGYGSAARFIANAVRDATYDTMAAHKTSPINFIDVMGRDAGWLAAAGGLAFDEDERDLAPLIYFPERPPVSAEAVLLEIEQRVKVQGWAVCVVPETLRDSFGQHLSGRGPDHVDPFGHAYYLSPVVTLTRLASEKLGLRARFDRPGTASRMSISLASSVDLDEAYRVGWRAAELAGQGQGEVMVTLVRESNSPYHSSLGSVPLEQIAAKVRNLPDEFIARDTRSTTPAFRNYALPLLGPKPFPVYGRLERPA